MISATGALPSLSASLSSPTASSRAGRPGGSERIEPSASLLRPLRSATKRPLPPAAASSAAFLLPSREGILSAVVMRSGSRLR